MLTLHFPYFTLTHDPHSGLTTTTYLDGHCCPCPVVPDDSIHAQELGITPQQHRLEHELWHHLVGIYVLGLITSPVIYKEAYNLPASSTSDSESIDGPWGKYGSAREEWLVTALSHLAHGDASREYGARWYLENEVGVKVDWLVEEFKRLLVEVA